METIKGVVQALGQPKKTAKGGTMQSFKVIDTWVSSFDTLNFGKGDTVELEVEKKGDYTNLKKVVSVEKGVGVVTATPTNGYHAFTFEDYKNTVQKFHTFVKSLEPDSAEARAAIVNTFGIALTNGKVTLPKEEIPF